MTKTSEEAWSDFGAALARFKSAVQYAALVPEAGFLEEELALRDQARVYADACVRKATEPQIVPVA